MASPLADLVLWLHTRAVEDKRLVETSDEAAAFLAGCAGQPYSGADEAGYLVGLEIYSGRPHSDSARAIQRRAYRALHSLTLVLSNVDEAGYTAVNIRPLLEIHYQALNTAPLGSELHCVAIDLYGATLRASLITRDVAILLASSYSAAEIGARYQTNGSRRVAKAMTELAKILQGKRRLTV